LDLTQTVKVAPSLIDKVVGPTSLFLKSNAPVIITAAGIVGVVTAGVLAARATRHLDPILEEHRDALRTTHLEKAKAIEAGDGYDNSKHAKSLMGTYAGTSVKLCKLYGSSVTLGALSIAAIVTGHNMQYKRFLTAATALKGSEAAFSEYREQVAKVLGEEAESDIYRGIREEIVENEETGNEEVKKYLTDRPVSQYARSFAPETTTQWMAVPLNNDYTVNAVEDYLNGRLQRLGHVFLSEAYEKLGFDVTQASRMVGWLKDGKDGEIKFRPERFHRDNGDTVLLLDFNVDGVILNALPEV